MSFPCLQLSLHMMSIGRCPEAREQMRCIGSSVIDCSNPLSGSVEVNTKDSVKYYVLVQGTSIYEYGNYVVDFGTCTVITNCALLTETCLQRTG